MADLSVELAYALPEKQTLLSLSVAEGSTVEQVIETSGILAMHPDIQLDNEHKVGIWSRACKLSTEVSEGDRVEIYRPLIADPKQIRKQRAEKAKQEGRADKVTGGRVNPRRSEN